MDNVTSRQSIATHRPLVYAAALLYLMTGCATPWEKSALLKDTTPNIDSIKGPTHRSLLNLKKQQQDEDDKIAGKSLKPVKGTDEYLAATELFKDEKYEDARRAFKKVAKQFKKSEIREDALFMQAESAWLLDQYAVAHDAYAILLKDFPSTRHMNVVSERLFKIGRLWLEFPEVAKLGEIHQVNFDEPKNALPSEEPPKVPKPVPIFVPNFRDKQKPLFDTAGNGVAALTAVWMNDPTGPLADDSMMLVASYYARRGNYVEADRFFQMLRETFPNSPHVENAFVLGSHVKLMSYQGPDYESKTLSEAQLLKEATIKLYPNNVEVDRMKEELIRIEDAKALVIWKTVEFYVRKKKPKAVAIHCHELITQYPKSSYADKARAKLEEMGPEYVSGTAFLQPVDPPKAEFVLSYKLKKSPMIGPARDTAKSGANKGTKSSDVLDANSNSRQKAKAADESKDGDYEEPSDDVEQAPTVDPEKPAKKRRTGWFPFGSPPKSLPDDAADDAKPLGSSSSSRTSLR